MCLEFESKAILDNLERFEKLPDLRTQPSDAHTGTPICHTIAFPWHGGRSPRLLVAQCCYIGPNPAPPRSGGCAFAQKVHCRCGSGLGRAQNHQLRAGGRELR